jgi:UDP-N-acetylglucosamine:LPS N-acetylglucosamine transferase
MNGVSFPTKVLYLFSDTGNGHKSVADAIASALAEITGKATKDSQVEVFSATAIPILRLYPRVYAALTLRHVWLYDLVFRATNTYRLSRMLARMIYWLARRKVLQVLTAEDPEVVVVTTPFVSQIVCDARRELTARFRIVTVVGDLVSAHASWACPDVDLCVVYGVELRERMRNLGVPDDRLVQTRFPIRPDFLDDPHDKAAARRELGIEENRFAILLTGGGLGAGPIMSVSQTLERLFPDAQLLVVAGANVDLHKQLLASLSGAYTHVFQFVEHMHTLVSASDVVVSKAGPSTIMEACASHRPIVVVRQVGVQEHGNGAFVERNGLGCFAPTLQDLIRAVRRLLDDPSWRVGECRPPALADRGSDVARAILARWQAGDGRWRDPCPDHSEPP